MYIVFRGVENTPFSHPAESIMGMFMMSLGEFGDYYEAFASTNYAALGQVRTPTTFVSTLIICCVTLLIYPVTFTFNLICYHA